MDDVISRQLRDLQSEQQEKQHGRIFQEIVVEYPSISTYLEYKGKPYFSIKYTENGQEFIGYGTYSPEVLSGYLKEYFMPPAEPKIIRCKDCQDYQTDWNPSGATGRHYCATMDSFMLPDGFCSYAERRESKMDDTISRQTVLDALDEISREVDDGDGFDYAKWREYFCELPSAKLATDTNVGTKLGTNLAEVGTDLISRQAAIDVENNK